MWIISWILTWLGGFVAGCGVGYAIGQKLKRKATATLTVGPLTQPAPGEPIDFAMSTAFVDEAPIEFLMERGQTREQFADQVAHAVDLVRAEGHRTPQSALHSFAEKIGVAINGTVEVTAEEAHEVLAKQKDDYLKRAN
jgi:hypothetical protein